jgi:tetratricopeptide (TPR) repeat protein
VRGWILALVVVTAACSTTTPLDRGLALSQRGRDLAAAAAFDEEIRRAPESAAAYANRGIVRARLGDLDGAIADYTKVLALESRQGNPFFNRCLARTSKGDYQGAIGDCTSALAESPSHAGTFFARGSARWLAGNADQARGDWVKAIELEPDALRKTRMLAAVDSAPPVAAAPRPSSSPSSGSTAAARMDAPLDPRALAARGLERELKGDRQGAIADLRAALAAETDPERRQGLRNLLQLLGTP